MITNITVQTLSMLPTQRLKQLYVMNLVQSGFESQDQVNENKFVEKWSTWSRNTFSKHYVIQIVRTHVIQMR